MPEGPWLVAKPSFRYCDLIRQPYCFSAKNRRFHKSYMA